MSMDPGSKGRELFDGLPRLLNYIQIHPGKHINLNAGGDNYVRVSFEVDHNASRYASP